MLLVHDIAQSLNLIRQHIRTLADCEQLPLQLAGGRILAAPVKASEDVPPFCRSQVDGLAVWAADTFGASETIPAILAYQGEVQMGRPVEFRLQPGQCAYVPTGGELPAGADAMVMIEQVEDLGDGLRQVSQSVSPGTHLTRQGDDITAGTTVFRAGRRLNATDLGTLAALGLATVPVVRRPRVAILSTGDELIEPDTRPGPGQIYDVNRYTLAETVRLHGGEPVISGIVRDDLTILQQALGQALGTCDLVLVSGGSSVGTRDYVAAAINSLGEPGVILHGIAVKPGKPTMAGVCNGKLVLGLPGHPVAAWFMAHWLAGPVLAWLQGSQPLYKPTVQAMTACRIPSNHGREEFVLVTLQNGDQPLAVPVFAKSGLITLLSRSDGYIRIPRDCEGLPQGAPVSVYLL